MASFQINVLIFAVILLVGSLAMIAFMLKKNIMSQTWPPTVGECPDYWSLSGTVCTAPSSGNVGDKKVTTIDTKSFTFTDLTGSTGEKSTGNCGFQKWANAHAIMWDGITNANNLCGK